MIGGEYHVIVGNGQDDHFLLLDPLRLLEFAARATMTIPSRIIPKLVRPALLANLYPSPQRPCPAHFQLPHHLRLAHRHRVLLPVQMLILPQYGPHRVPAPLLLDVAMRLDLFFGSTAKVTQEGRIWAKRIFVTD